MLPLWLVVCVVLDSGADNSHNRNVVWNEPVMKKLSLWLCLLVILAGIPFWYVYASDRELQGYIYRSTNNEDVGLDYVICIPERRNPFDRALIWVKLKDDMDEREFIDLRCEDKAIIDELTPFENSVVIVRVRDNKIVRLLGQIKWTMLTLTNTLAQ